MRVVELVFAGAWAAFWLAAAFSMKRGRVPWSHELSIRVVIAAVVLVWYRLGAFRHHSLNTAAWRDAVGVLLLATGLVFAIWARRHIGRNWGMPTTRKVAPELVPSGPHRIVRHPIYSGILLATVGTAVGLSLTWLIAALLATTYFIYSATVEERYMTEQFPDTNPAYKQTTKMLAPFLL